MLPKSDFERLILIGSKINKEFELLIGFKISLTIKNSNFAICSAKAKKGWAPER